jgi:hypothetical protein
MEINFYGPPDHLVHAPGAGGQDIGVLELDMMTQAYAVLGHG